MNGYDSQRAEDQTAMKRRSWQEMMMMMKRRPIPSSIVPNNCVSNNSNIVEPLSLLPKTATTTTKTTACSFRTFDVDDDLLSTVIPPVTVVIEGRSICQRISLHKHASYQSLAKALRQMYVDIIGGCTSMNDNEDELDLSNAIPGYLIAYEDMENDLLLAGDLNWKDFVRVAKRIRILPVKGKSRKGR